MKFHRNLVYAVLDGLQLIFTKNQYADKVVEKLLKRDKRWGARDRGFIAETLYEIVRWKRLYAEIAEVKEPFDRDKLWRVFAVWAVLRGYQLPNWKYFENTPTRRIKGRFDELSKIRKFAESIPDWLDILGDNTFGSNIWSRELAALNQPADVFLRVNTLKTNTKELQKKLEAEKFESETVGGLPQALKLKERAHLFQTEAFQNGLFEVQDAGSQKVAPFLSPEPGMRVADACAGAGGKTLHLAAMMENKGQVMALDIYPQKLNELKRRARRAGAHNIETRLIETAKHAKKLYGKFDRVLIDAPCTGLGVLRRNPDAKWKLKPENLEEILLTQKDILKLYAPLTKENGVLVYATCSILPQENQQQIKAFLETDLGKTFQFIEEKTLWPSEGFDGFYMAKIRKLKIS